MVDVETLREYCEFGGDRVYLLMAIARSKENEGTASNREPVVREVVEDEGELGQKIEQLDHAVSRFDERFRLYLSANARDALAATFRLRQRTDDWIEARLHGDDGVRRKFKRIDREYKSTLQSDACKDETNFVFDLDGVSESEATEFERSVAEHAAVAMVRETPNGYHVVTEPFNYHELDTTIEYELKTDGMVFVDYIGE